MPSLRALFVFASACALAACSSSTSGSPIGSRPTPEEDGAPPVAAGHNDDAGALVGDAAVPECTDPRTTFDPATRTCVPTSRTPEEECAARGPKFTFEPVTGRCLSAAEYVAQLDGAWLLEDPAAAKNDGGAASFARRNVLTLAAGKGTYTTTHFVNDAASCVFESSVELSGFPLPVRNVAGTITFGKETRTMGDASSPLCSNFFHVMSQSLFQSTEGFYVVGDEATLVRTAGLETTLHRVP